MSNSTTEAKRQPHSDLDFDNLWMSQRLIRNWINNPNLSSYDVIPRIYMSLHRDDIQAYNGDRVLFLHQLLRKTNIRITGTPSNFLPEGKDVYLLMANYCDELDRILRTKPKRSQKAIEDAAFSYYVFERIHPFPDGNGRTGRMITKAILKSAGLRDPSFHDQRWYGAKRSEHLTSMEKVGETNNLAHLELYFAKTLHERYVELGDDQRKIHELSEIVKTKNRETDKDPRDRLLRDIWSGFGDLPIHGNIPQSYQSFYNVR